jgi:tRNA-modifying protein YgfZ
MTDGYQALRHGAAWLDLSARGRFLARGRDRARYLHNVTSNDVKKLASGSGSYAFVLTPQGRIQADLYLLCFPDYLLLDTEPELRDRLPQLILRYKVADQVELEDVTLTTAAIGLEGPGAAAVLAAVSAPVPGADYAHLPWGESTVANISLTGQPGFRIYCPAGVLGEMATRLEAAGAKPASPDDARMVRIENGRPRFGEDIRETSLPQETGQMHAVSFTKGCYVGQEIVERIRAQGHVNRKLVRLEIESAEPPNPGTKLTANGADVGEITSATVSPESGKTAAIGSVRATQANPGAALTVGESEARVL